MRLCQNDRRILDLGGVNRAELFITKAQQNIVKQHSCRSFTANGVALPPSVHWSISAQGGAGVRSPMTPADIELALPRIDTTYTRLHE